MSTFGRSENPSILIVAQGDDPPVRDAAAALSNAGVDISVVPDVYTAMAQLSLCSDIRHVLLDVRHLDPHERFFLQLAPRYFRDLQISVADLPGASARMRLEENQATLKSLSAFVASVTSATVPSAVSAKDAQLDTALSTTQHPEVSDSSRSLSTDPDQLAEDPSPSLHEAVRRRMTADDAGAIQRKPPVRTPPRQGPTVSPQELDALLAPDSIMNLESHPGDANTGRHR